MWTSWILHNSPPSSDPDNNGILVLPKVENMISDLLRNSGFILH